MSYNQRWLSEIFSRILQLVRWHLASRCPTDGAHGNWVTLRDVNAWDTQTELCAVCVGTCLVLFLASLSKDKKPDSTVPFPRCWMCIPISKWLRTLAEATCPLTYVRTCHRHQTSEIVLNRGNYSLQEKTHNKDKFKLRPWKKHTATKEWLKATKGEWWKNKEGIVSRSQ